MKEAVFHTGCPDAACSHCDGQTFFNTLLLRPVCSAISSICDSCLPVIPGLPTSEVPDARAVLSASATCKINPLLFSLSIRSSRRSPILQRNNGPGRPPAVCSCRCAEATLRFAGGPVEAVARVPVAPLPFKDSTQRRDCRGRGAASRLAVLENED